MSKKRLAKWSIIKYLTICLGWGVTYFYPTIAVADKQTFVIAAEKSFSKNYGNKAFKPVLTQLLGNMATQLGSDSPIHEFGNIYSGGIEYYDILHACPTDTDSQWNHDTFYTIGDENYSIDTSVLYLKLSINNWSSLDKAVFLIKPRDVNMTQYTIYYTEAEKSAPAGKNVINNFLKIFSPIHTYNTM